MEKPIARVSDLSSGHACFPPTPILPYIIIPVMSPTVFANNLGVARKGDTLKAHKCPLTMPMGGIGGGMGGMGEDAGHDSYLWKKFSKTVITNKLPTACVGTRCKNDLVPCPQVIITGSNNVFIGGIVDDECNNIDLSGYDI